MTCKNSAALLANHFSTHNYHIYWQQNTLNLIISVSVPHQVCNSKLKTDRNKENNYILYI